MDDGQYNWKDERIRSFQESLSFFSNREKLDREKWTVRRLLRALNVEFAEEELTGGDEPVDIYFRDARFQENRAQDVLKHPTDYKCQIVRLDLPALGIPKRTFLDYNNIPYNIVEVNLVSV